VIDLTAVLNRRADRLLKGRGDINANPLVTEAGMKIESGMLLSGLAAAVGLAAGAVLEDQSAAEQGFIGEELDGAAARVALLG
jgi:transketolase N-terminal domain/subunit